MGSDRGDLIDRDCLVWWLLLGFTRLDAAVPQAKAALGHPSPHGPVESSFGKGLIILLVRREFHKVQSAALIGQQKIEGVTRMAQAF